MANYHYIEPVIKFFILKQNPSFNYTFTNFEKKSLNKPKNDTGNRLQQWPINNLIAFKNTFFL